MTRPPTLSDVEQALVELRKPHEHLLLEMRDRRDELIESQIQTSAAVDPEFIRRSNRLRRRIREQQRIVNNLPQSVYRTVVICHPDTEQLSAVALVPDDASIPAITVGGWTVDCVPPSLRLLRCGVGEIVPRGLVVSINGSPVLPDETVRRALDDLHQPPISRAEQRRIDRAARRALFESFMADRKVRESAWLDAIFVRQREREQIERTARMGWRLPPKRREPTAMPTDPQHDGLAYQGPEGQYTRPTPQPKGPETDSTAGLAPDAEADEAGVSGSQADVGIDNTPAAHADVWRTFIAFTLGSIAGLALVPHWFSLVGLASAGLTVLWRLWDRGRGKRGIGA